MFPNAVVHRHPDERSLAQAAAGRWAALAEAAIAERGEFHIALTGGSTPRTLYGLLATPEWLRRIDWRRAQVYFGDERCVPPEHPDSNFRMANEALLSKCPLAPHQIHRIEAEREPKAAARAYAGVLREHLAREGDGERPPRFDLLLLGLGPDGHIASLFPGSPLLQETAEWVGAAYVKKLKAWRVSLTYPVLDAARHTLFLVAGPAKAAAVQAALGGHWSGAEPLPVERLRPSGPVEWLVDEAAAAGLDHPTGEKG
jgi:6-phosphogluconolactonase